MERFESNEWVERVARGAAQIRFHPYLFGQTQIDRNWCAQGVIQHRDVRFHYVDKGGFDLWMGNAHYEVGQGALVLIANDVPHRCAVFRHLEHAEITFIRFRIESDLGICRPNADVELLEVAGSLRPLMGMVLQELRGVDTLNRAAARGLMSALLAQFVQRLRAQREAGPRLSASQRARIETCLPKGSGHWPTPRALAEASGLSTFYFARVFRDSYGVSPRQWLKERRVHEVARLLTETVMSVGEISDHLGYYDASFMARQFRDVIGVSPRVYRATEGE